MLYEVITPKIISGEEKMCFAVTEPNSGLDTSSLETKAERTNNGYVINGRKIWTTGAQRADKILIRITSYNVCYTKLLRTRLTWPDLHLNAVRFAAASKRVIHLQAQTA